MNSPTEARGLTKHFGEVVAVDDLTFSVRPGEVTGFLGRNGAGKTTTLRMILGLARPTSGTATINGLAYADLDLPLRHVGSLLNARAVQPGSTAADHLVIIGDGRLLVDSGTPAFQRDHEQEEFTYVPRTPTLCTAGWSRPGGACATSTPPPSP